MVRNLVNTQAERPVLSGVITAHISDHDCELNFAYEVTIRLDRYYHHVSSMHFNACSFFTCRQRKQFSHKRVKFENLCWNVWTMQCVLSEIIKVDSLFPWKRERTLKVKEDYGINMHLQFQVLIKNARSIGTSAFRWIKILTIFW